MSFDDVVAEIHKMYIADRATSNPVTIEHVEIWSAACACSKPSLFEKLAVRLAAGFYKESFSFDFCDDLINDLWWLQWSHHIEPSKLFWNVYEAFDMGEGSVERVNSHSRPAIAYLINKSDWPCF